MSNPKSEYPKVIKAIPKRGFEHPFLRYIWNPIGGECEKKCWYCYLYNGEQKRSLFFSGKPKLVIKGSIGKELAIYVGSMNDMFADNVPSEMIEAVLEKALTSPNNLYLFQTKYPNRYFEFISLLKRFKREKLLLGISVGTNRESGFSERIDALNGINEIGFRTFITVEPLLKFDMPEFGKALTSVSHQFYYLGRLRHYTKKQIEELKIELPSKEEKDALVLYLTVHSTATIYKKTL